MQCRTYGVGYAASLEGGGSETRPYGFNGNVNCARLKKAGGRYKFNGKFRDSGYQAWLRAQRHMAREACQASEPRLPETFAVPVIPSRSEPSGFANSTSTAK